MCKKKFLIASIYMCLSLLLFCAFFYFNSIQINKNNIANTISFQSVETCAKTQERVLNSTNLDVSNDLDDQVDTQIDNLETDKYDEILNNLDEREKGIFEGQSFWQKVKKIISGEEAFDFGQIINMILSLLVDNLSSVIPILALICAISIISSLLLQFRGKSLNKPLGDIIHFASFAIIAVIVLNAVLHLVSLTSSTLNSLKSQMEITFPIMLTLMASLGAGSSVAIYQPILAILCGIIMQIFTKVLLPVFSLTLIFNVVGNLTDSVKFSRFNSFLNSLFKYVIGFTFTIFTGFLAVSGISAGSFDGVSIRATKYAIKSYVPFLGGYISDGFSLIMASSILIKNAVGFSGLLVMFLSVISPILKIILFKLGLSLVSGIIESVADKRVTNFLASTSKSLTMLSTVIIAFSFAYLISTGLLMCSSNVFWGELWQ